MAIVRIGHEKYGIHKMSAFVEDSILLGGFSDSLNSFADLLSITPLDIVWGYQFTIDKLLDSEIQSVVQRLSKLGLKYIFAGLETNDEDIARGLSKSSISTQSWMSRNKEVINFLSGLNIDYGVSLMFGLGESQESRVRLMTTVREWKEKYKIPNVISMNLAVQHPLRKYAHYDYIEWGTTINSEYLEMFTSIFGEASEKYHLPHIKLPSMSDLNELRVQYELFYNHQNDSNPFYDFYKS